MKTKILLTILLATIFVSLKQDDTASMIRDIHHLVNKHRNEVGLKSLEYNNYMEEIATKHSRNMASGKVPFGHDGFNKRAAILMKKINAEEVGENVAYGSGNITVQEIVKAWLESPGHRKNIEGNYNETGIGIATSKDGTLFYTQIFCRR
jgi:uncharacterized protein YkwD